MVQTIESRDNARVKRAVRLRTDADAREEEALFCAEGLRLCLDLAAQQRPRAAFATKEVLAAQPQLEALAEELFLVSGPVAEKLAGTKSPQGLVCLFEMPAGGLQPLDFEAGVLVCEAMQDPANVGAVLRSAAALGFGGVALTPGSADPYGPRALRAAAGAVLRVNIWRQAPLAQVAALAAEEGARFVAAALRGAVPLWESRRETPLALLVGNEGAGLSSEALALAQERVFIPMARGVESLNAAVAASLMMYHYRGGPPAGES